MRYVGGLAVVLLGCPASDWKDTDDPGTFPTDPQPPTPTTTPEPTTPDPLLCDLAEPAPYIVDVDASCEAEPPVGGFDPVVEWTWSENPIVPGYHQVVVTPAVVDLDQDGIPDIVFMAFLDSHYGSGGALTAISGADGTTLWSLLEAGGLHPRGTGGVAVGDSDADGHPEVVVPAEEGLLCVDHQGNLAWASPVLVDNSAMPAIGDLEGDGLGEVIVGKIVWEHDGTVRWTGTEGQGGAYHVASFPADLDVDGVQEVVAGNTVYEGDGQVRWTDGGQDGKPAIADFDGDGTPEVVRVYGGVVHLADDDGTELWTFPLPDGVGGAPMVADLDGDGTPEIGVASREYYRVLGADGVERWANPIREASSALTSSSAFDLEGDGPMEILYADEHTFYLWDGPTGDVKWQLDSHSSGTLHEYPVVADVDGDGSAEIVVASNDYAIEGSHGITVIGDRASSWRPARPVWNQHAYAITNIEDDGGIPTSPVPSWTASNTFRAGDPTVAVTSLADLTVGEPQTCVDECPRVWAWFPVENRGLADVSATLVVTRGDRTQIVDLEIPLIVSGTAVWAGPVALETEDFGVTAEVVSDGGDCVISNDASTWTENPCP